VVPFVSVSDVALFCRASSAILMSNEGNFVKPVIFWVSEVLASVNFLTRFCVEDVIVTFRGLACSLYSVLI
jgi:hypothetical protein